MSNRGSRPWGACACLLPTRTLTNAYPSGRKFFGRPPGSSPKPQQSKLAFQTSHTTKAVKGEHEEGDGAVKAEDREEADAVDIDIADDENLDMDSESEVHESAMDRKRAVPILNGMKKVDSSLANGKGELST